MYLAGILGLCALLHVPAPGRVSSGRLSFALFAEAAVSGQESNQEPAKPEPPTPAAPQPERPNPDAAQPAPQENNRLENVPQPQPSPNPPATSAVPKGGENQHDQKPPASRKHPVRRKHTSPAAAGQGPKKKVVHRGGAEEPSTQLAPGMTDEQAARQRQSTNQLLASTDVSLQKLSGRQLTREQQDTVTQVRKFMEQVKAADAAGDLQRAYKLALKAHLLSDALAQP